MKMSLICYTLGRRRYWQVFMNSKNPAWNSHTSNPSGEKPLLNPDFQISAPQSPTPYTPRGNGDILDIVIHQNVRLSDVTVSDVLDPDHLPIIFSVWIMLVLGTLRPRMKHPQTGICFET